MTVTIYKYPSHQILDKTISAIKELAWKSRGNPGLKKLAVWILDQRGIDNGREKQAAALAISQWIGSNIRYYNDPFNLDTIQSPEQTIIRRYGDCDDMAALQAALYMTIGLPVRFRVVGGDRPEHIYVETNIPLAGWIGYDPASVEGDPHPAKLTTFRLEGYGGINYANYSNNGSVKRRFSGPK